MTLTDSRTNTTISSIRWLDEQGEPCSRSIAKFRLWSARTKNRRFFIAMPVEMHDIEVLALATDVYQSMNGGRQL